MVNALKPFKTSTTSRTYATEPDFNMLTQPTERYKLGPAIRLWAPVYLVLVACALEVLVEPSDTGLIRGPVERGLRRPRNHGRRRLGAAQ